MAWSPIRTDQSISYVRNNSNFRNANRESRWGSPVFYTPSNWAFDLVGGYGGPKYSYGYNYDNSSSTIYGNCTWWCEGRVYETQGTHLGGLGNAIYWYDNYSGSKDRNANNIQAGDVIVYSDSSAGHVMFVEEVSGNTIYISHSAYSSRSVWNGYACRVGNYQKSDIVYGNSINMYKDIGGSAYNVTVVGVIHTGGTPPTPPTTDDNIEVLIDCILNKKKRKMRITIE